jgi:YVTN family beta-propeller protein
MPRTLVLALTVVVCGAAAPGGSRAFAAEPPQYRFLKDIPIGGEGGWDYLSTDSAGRRLYVSHATKVVVIDLDRETVVGEIADTPGVHGFAIAPDLGLGFASNGRESTVSIVDLKTLSTLAKVATGENPDAILYEPGRHEVYSFNGRGRSATVIDPKTKSVVATIPLDAKPESGAADPQAHRVYVNLEDKNAIAVIDTATRKVVETWPIAPGESATGMAFDVARHRLFVGCGNKLMLMLDSTTGKVVAQVPTGAGVDATWFDPETGLAFSSAGEGTVTIAHEDSPDRLTVVQVLQTERSARTMALDPRTHRIYLSSAKFGPEPETPAGGQRQRPPMIPGSFHVLVFGPGTDALPRR